MGLGKCGKRLDVVPRAPPPEVGRGFSPCCCQRPLPLPGRSSPPCPAESSPLQPGAASDPLQGLQTQPRLPGSLSRPPLTTVPHGLPASSSRTPPLGPVQVTSWEFSLDASLHLQGSVWGGGGVRPVHLKPPLPAWRCGSRGARTARACVCLGLPTSEVTEGQALSSGRTWRRSGKGLAGGADA